MIKVRQIIPFSRSA